MATKYPIVLAHGFDASTTNRWSFYRVRAELMKTPGQVVVLAEVQPYNSSDVRGLTLGAQVDAAIEAHGKDLPKGEQKVNVIAHSMGGIDARYMISKHGYGDRVASLTTIATPHKGSRIADVLLGVAPADVTGADAIASVWAKGFTAKELAANSEIRAALESISEGNAANVDQATPDDERVCYRSWAGVSSLTGLAGPNDPVCDPRFSKHAGRVGRTDPTLAAGAPIVAHWSANDANDGMVTVDSAKGPRDRVCPQGSACRGASHDGKCSGAWHFQGCIPADHLGEVGQPERKAADPWTGFDHIEFYRAIAADLAAKGF